MNNIDPILMDMDGVFADFAAGYYALARQVDPELYEALMEPKEQLNYYLHDHITDPELHARGDAISNHPSIFDILPPYEEAIEGMQRLKRIANEQEIDVYICTAPHTSNKKSYISKPKWIEHYLGHEWLDKTLIVRDKTLVRGSILVDDKPTPLGNFIPSWRHVVMPHSYNREQQKINFVFPGWSEDNLSKLVAYARYVSKKI